LRNNGAIVSAPAQWVEDEYLQRRDAVLHWPRLLPRRVFVGLCICIATLLCCYVLTVAIRLTSTRQSLFGMVHLFDLDAEANIPTYFSVVQLNIAAGLLWAIGAHARRRADRYTRHWLALAAIFLFLGLDELAQIHELIEDPVRAAFHLSGALRNAWVLPYAGLMLVLGWAYVPFLAHLPPRTRALTMVSALIYVGGAAGLEMYGGYLTTQLGGQAAAEHNVAYLTEVFFEEGMEMFGIALFIYTLLDHIRHTMGRVLVHVGSARRPTPAQELNGTQALQVLDRRRRSLTAP